MQYKELAAELINEIVNAKNFIKDIEALDYLDKLAYWGQKQFDLTKE